jgi:hypothetical protein
LFQIYLLKNVVLWMVSVIMPALTIILLSRLLILETTFELLYVTKLLIYSLYCYKILDVVTRFPYHGIIYVHMLGE